MIIQIIYCDICKKRIRSNQKVWFEDTHQYHFWCKYKESDPMPQEVMRRHGLPKALGEYQKEL